MIPRPPQNSGFSAVELLIVLAILGGMAAIGLPLSAGMIDDIKSKLDEYKQQIIDGEIEVPTEPQGS